MKRGIVSPPGVLQPLPNGFRMERTLSQEEINYLILYWDSVVIPSNNFLHVVLPNEGDLIACGAIERPLVQLQGHFNPAELAEAVLGCQAAVLGELIAKSDEDWLAHQLGGELCLKPQDREERNILRLSLTDSLPAPDATVPLVDILEFKERRHDELARLHSLLDSIYQGILREPDADLASKAAISELSEAVSDIQRLGQWGTDKKYSLSAQFGIDGAATAQAISAGAILDAFATGLSLPIGTVGAAILSMLKVEAKAEYAISLAHEKSKLSYLSNAAREGVLG